MTQQNRLGTPWSLHFDRDGTEDFAVIREAAGDELVTSRYFWLPVGDDPVPPTLSAVRLMAAAPKLLEALLVAEGVLRGSGGDGPREVIDRLLAEVRAALAGHAPPLRAPASRPDQGPAPHVAVTAWVRQRR